MAGDAVCAGSVDFWFGVLFALLGLIATRVLEEFEGEGVDDEGI